MSDFKAKMHQFRFPLGLCPRPRWGSLQRSPDPLAVFKGPTSNGRGGSEGRERGRGGKGKGLGRRRKGKGRGLEGSPILCWHRAHRRKLPPNSGGGSWPFPSPPLPPPPFPSPFLPLPPLPSLPLSLEVGPRNPARGLGERCKLRAGGAL